MKALVLYRSFYGNTKRVAEAIAGRLTEKGCEITVQDVRERLPDITQVDLVLNGAPTRIKRVNRRSLGVLRRLKAMGIADKPVAIFDTVAVIPTDPTEYEKAKAWLVPGAAGILLKRARALGLNVFPETLRCEVQGLKGPLAENAEEKALAFTDAVVAFARAR